MFARVTSVIALMAACCLPVIAQAPDLSKMDIVLKSVPAGPVANVDGVSISREEFVALYRNESELLRRRSGGELSDIDRVRAGMGCVMMLVERELLLREARARKLTVSKADVEAGWAEELERLQQTLARGAGQSPTEAQILEQAGATREQALADLEKAMLIEKVRIEIAEESGANVSDAEVADFYKQNKQLAQQPEQIHIKQIYFRDIQTGDKAEPAKRDAARKKGQDVLNRIRSGQKFEAVARAVSEGKYKENGGDFGPLPSNQLPPFLLEAASKMQPGEVSGIIESEYGVHIIMLVGMVEGKSISEDEAAPQIRKMLIAERSEDAVKEFCRKRTEEAGLVKIYLDFEKQLAFRPDLINALKASNEITQ